MAHIISFLRIPALFLIALSVGGVLASLYSLLSKGLAGTPAFVIGSGLSIAALSFIPALLFAAPALRQLGKRRVNKIPAAAILIVGGASVGHLLMAATFYGLEPFGAVVGSSIGLSMAVLVYPFINVPHDT